MPKCKEHLWRLVEGVWICDNCGQQASFRITDKAPCPRCGAPPEGDQVYCSICLDRLYGLELQDA